MKKLSRITELFLKKFQWCGKTTETLHKNSKIDNNKYTILKK